MNSHDLFLSHNSMFSAFRSIVCLVTLLALGLTPAAPRLHAQELIQLPDFGDSSGRMMTPTQEQALGQAFFRSLHSQVKINQDPEIEQFIESLGSRLAAHADNPGQPFHFFVVLDPAINAFAGPGGYVGINAGLVLETRSESELASVVAHEIAHVTQRHLMRAFETASRMALPTAAAMLAAILIGTQSPEAGQAALIAAQAGAMQHRIDFTRDNEQEADRVGMHILSRTDFDPRGMPVFFERLQRASRYYGEGPPEFLRTHPVTVSRIADSRGRAEKYPFRQYPDSLGYLLFKAKLRVMTAKRPRDASDHFRATLDQGTALQKSASQYGLGLALLAASRANQAQTVLQELAGRHPGQPQFVNALAKSRLEVGRTTEALALYAEAMDVFPGNRAVMLDYTKALLKTKHYEKARGLLRDYSRGHPPSSEIYQLLAETTGKIGKKAEAHRYLAEYYYAIGRTESAITQAEIGIKAAKGNFYLTAILEERLKRYIAEKDEEEKGEKWPH
jgi:beta-barrel assembly-enhancing protease